MSECRKCGREDGHWIGCARALAAAATGPVPKDQCEHDGCTEPKKPWSGKGARPKFCIDGHKKEK